MTSRESDINLSELGPRSEAATGGRRRRGRRSTFWRIREDIPRPLEISLMVVSLVAPLAIWTLLYLLHAANRIFLPSPLDAAQAGYDLAANGELWTDAWASTQRIFIGFGVSLLVAIPLGLGMGTFRSVRALFEPFIALIRYVPATAFVVLLIIWMGVDEPPKVTLVFLGTVFFNTLMIANVVWQVPGELIKASMTLGAGSGAVFRKVVLPHSVPGIIDAARVNLAAAWNLVIVVELFAAREGLGYRIVREQKFLHTDTIFAVIVVIGLIGLLMDLSLRMLRDSVAPWSQE